MPPMAEPGTVPSLFTGLSAFPLTPLRHDQVDEHSFVRLVERCVAAGVDSITALGSTGSYAYLHREERAAVARLAVEHAGETPVFVGIGALRTSDVLAHAEDAQAAGAAALLLAPMTYQPLTDDDVVDLFAAVTAASSVPVIVYDNPGTTHFGFSPQLYGRIAQLPGIASIKIPAVPLDPHEAREHVSRLRAVVPEYVGLGVSGDAHAARGLLAGCDAWYSTIAGTLPELAVTITRSAQEDRSEETQVRSAQLQPLWDLFAEHGSLRVVAAIAEHLGLAQRSCLPLPLRGLQDGDRAEVAAALERCRLHT